MTNYFEQFINESSKKLSREELMKELKKKYPSLWMKDSEDFDKGKTKNAIWTGSESDAVEKDGRPIFDYNAGGSKYELGIHKDLYNFLEKKGWYCEWYDSGTIFIFQDDINESFKSDLKDFLEDELKYNEDSHVTDADVDQIYHAFISKYNKYKGEKSLKIYDEIYGYFSVFESASKNWDKMSHEDKLSLLYGGQEVEILRGSQKGKKGIIQRVDFADNGEIVGDQIDVKVGNRMCYIGLDDIRINEAKVQLKRKYGTNPPHNVSSHAPMRERVLSFVKERGEVSEEEITEYVKGIREDVGKEGPSGWLKRNPEYFEKSGAKLILSKKGERFLASKKVNESSLLRFEEFVNEGSTAKSTGTMPLSDVLSIFVSDSRILTGQSFKDFMDDLYHSNDDIEDKTGIINWVEENIEYIEKNWSSPCKYTITKKKVSFETSTGKKFSTNVKDEDLIDDAIPVITYKKWLKEMF